MTPSDVLPNSDDEEDRDKSFACVMFFVRPWYEFDDGIIGGEAFAVVCEFSLVTSEV